MISVVTTEERDKSIVWSASSAGESNSDQMDPVHVALEPPGESCTYDWHYAADPFSNIILYNQLRELYNGKDGSSGRGAFPFEIRDFFGNFLSHGAPGPGGAGLEATTPQAKGEFLKICTESYLMPRVKQLQQKYTPQMLADVQAWCSLIWSDPVRVYDEMHNKLAAEFDFMNSQDTFDRTRDSMRLGGKPVTRYVRSKVSEFAAPVITATLPIIATPLSDKAVPIDVLLGISLDDGPPQERAPSAIEQELANEKMRVANVLDSGTKQVALAVLEKEEALLRTTAVANALPPPQQQQQQQQQPSTIATATDMDTRPTQPTKSSVTAKKRFSAKK